MEKLAYLLRMKKSITKRDSHQAIHPAMLGEVPAAMVGQGAWNIVINIADMTDEVRTQNPARIMGAMDGILAEVEFWIDTYNQREGVEALLSEYCDELHGYLVTESLVEHFDRRWKDGERRPGITQLCVFDKGEQCPEEDFYHIWHEILSPMAADLHPHRTGYVRNAIARPLTPGAGQFRGIVKEYWSSLNDWVDDDRYTDPAVAEVFFPKVGNLSNMDTMILGPTSEYCFATRG